MKKYYGNILDLIGDTPLVELKTYTKTEKLGARIFAKLESFNPGGSVKDRIALSMIEDAEKKGLLKKGSTIIEPTSGNTGIGLALVGAVKGYEVILTMPETMSKERRELLSAYGAKLHLTDGSLGMHGSIARAKELASSIPDSFIPQQFENPANTLAHYQSTGPEVWKDMEGDLDIFVSGIGTGGTISGAGRFLLEKRKDLQVIAVEPEDSAVLSGGEPGRHSIQGIGAGFIPKVLDTDIYSEIIRVAGEDALSLGRRFPLLEGFLIGISSAAALHAASVLAVRPENAGKNIVVVFPDGGEKYMSTSLYTDRELIE